MNERFERLEKLITDHDGTINDIFSKRQRETNLIEQILSLNPTQAYNLSTSIQAQYDSLKNGIVDMRKDFGEGIQQIMKDKPDPGKLTPYQNVLPYGLEKGEPIVERGNVQLKPDVNLHLQNLDPSLTKDAHSTYTKLYHRMFPDTYKEIKQEMFNNYADSSISEANFDMECLNHIFRSAVGSMFDWPSIDRKSVGMGSIEHIAELFQKYYFGEVDDTSPRPWEEKQSEFRKYGQNDTLEIQGDKFYNDFVNGFFFRSCLEKYKSNEKTVPSGFEKEISGFYDFNPDLWVDNNDTTDPKKFKYSDNHDSYGNFFKVKQPIRIVDARTAEAPAGHPDPRLRASYTGVLTVLSWETAVTNAEGKINTYTGMYNTISSPASQSFILTREEKVLCCLFHKANIRDREFAAGPIAQRSYITNSTLEPLDFKDANKDYYGNGTDAGPAANSALAGNNDPINRVAQLLYNSSSIGFHKTRGQVTGIDHSSTLLVVNGNANIQMITGSSSGVETDVDTLIAATAANQNISNGASSVAAATQARRWTNLFNIATGNIYAATSVEIVTAFRTNTYQYIPIASLMKGGRLYKNKMTTHKCKHHKISKKKLPQKEKKQNPVKKVKKQKGGATGNFFDIRQPDPNGTHPALDASRREETITKEIFENYRKAIKEYVKTFGKGASQTKINDDILQKLIYITHIGIFYHGPDKELNFGGDSQGNTGRPNNIKFKQLGEMFLFCSVITNTIKLMIHFFKNIQKCIVHFIKNELEKIKDNVNTKLKSANITNISSLNASYFDKYIDGCEELNINIEKLVKFLQNNTMCLGEPKSSGNSAEALTKDEQSILNLFFGANISHQVIANPNKDAGPLKNNPKISYFYNLQFYKFHHELIDFFSINANQNFKKLNLMKFQKTLRLLTSNDMVLNNGYQTASAAPGIAYPRGEYSKTFASFGGIPFTFIDYKATQYSWMTFMFLLTYREKSNEKLKEEIIGGINHSLSQISESDKKDIKKEVIDKYKQIHPIIADPKIDMGSKNKILQKVFYSFFEDSNRIAKEIIDDHSSIEKKSKKVNIRSRITITNIVQRRHLASFETGRILITDEIKIQQKMKKFSYKVDCLINLLHTMLVSGTHGSIKNYTIFMYAISRLRNFVYRLYYLNKTYYMENETTKKLLLLESGFDLSKNSTHQDKHKIHVLFNKLVNVQLKDQNSNSEDWWTTLEETFRAQTSKSNERYFRLFVYVLMDNEVFLVDVFEMAKSTHSVKKLSELMKIDVEVYADHQSHEIYSPNNIFIKLPTDLSKDTKYKKLLNGELYYEYMKPASGNKKTKLLEALFIQGSTIEQLNSIIRDNHNIPSAGGKPAHFVISQKPESSFQLYKINKHDVFNSNAFRSWTYNLLFSMPTRIDVDDSYFKLHIQLSFDRIPMSAKSQILPSLKFITEINKTKPIVEFKLRARTNNNSKILMNNNINNKKVKSYAKYISREQIILLGLVFGDSLH